MMHTLSIEPSRVLKVETSTWMRYPARSFPETSKLGPRSAGRLEQASHLKADSHSSSSCWTRAFP
eukprot:6481953-Amphidinium_carterae.1